MPIYEYACEKCEREFEAEQRITDPPLKSCPHCRSRRVKRLISQTSFVLKGAGWYSDLYSSSAKKAESSGDGTSPDGTGGGDDAKGGKGDADKGGTDKKSADAKPAAKSDGGGTKPGPKPGSKSGKPKAAA